MSLETHLLGFAFAAIVFTVFAFGWGEYVNRKEARTQITDSSADRASPEQGGEK